MFKIVQRLSNLLGVGTARSRPAPEFQLITDGLMVTATTATAWFEMGTSNTDLASEAVVDAELSEVIQSVTPLLRGHSCHLKLLSDRADGQEYLESLDFEPTAWDDRRADWLDEYEVSTRRILLGVTLDDNRQDGSRAVVRQKAGAALGLPLGKIAPAERDWLHGKVRELGQALNGTPWTVSLAAAETLAWIVHREMHRGALLPRAGTFTGASLSHLTRGKIVPYGDHLEVLDETGETLRHVVVLALTGFPETIDTPGPQEWLRTLSLVTRVDRNGAQVPVVCDASVRFTALTDQDARRRVETVRQSAREQRMSATKHSAGETPDEVADTEASMRQISAELSRGRLTLVESHPRIIVSEATAEDCEAAVQAVMTHYASIGITVYRAEEEQRELWLEQLPGDQLRVSDLGHVMDAEGFFGSWWWGGSQVGDGGGAPKIAVQTGSTPGVVRFSAKAGSSRGDATTVAFVGRSGRGKTTALDLSVIDAVMDGATHCLYISIKGDDLALVDVARRHGIPAALTEIGVANRGALDLFRALPAEDAITGVTRLLRVLAPNDRMREIVETHGLDMVAEEAEETDPTTYGVIQRLLAHSNPDAQYLGRQLSTWAKSRFGAPVLGEPGGMEALPTGPGLWMVRIPGLSLPRAGRDPSNWDPDNRLSLAVVQALTLTALSMANRPDLREMAKLVCIPEVHRLAGSEEGLDFLDQTARLGRAVNENLLIDTQDVSWVLKLPGVMEQISTVFCFQLMSPTEQDAAAALLGLESGPDTRELLLKIGWDNNPVDSETGRPLTDKERGLRKGHCIMRDYLGRVGTVQWVIPDKETEIALNTNPDAQRLRDEFEAARARRERESSGSDEPQIDEFIARTGTDPDAYVPEPDEDDR